MIDFSFGCAEKDAVLNSEQKQSLQKAQKVVVLIHGYSSRVENVKQIYEQFSLNLKKYSPKALFIIGFYWESLSDDEKYFEDIAIAENSAKNLNELLLFFGRKEIVIIAHSMGIRLLNPQHFQFEKNIKQVVLLGAELPQFLVKEYFHNLTVPVHHFYSEHDQALVSIQEKFVFPKNVKENQTRIGVLGEKEDLSENFVCYDCSEMSGSEFQHMDFFSSEKVQNRIAELFSL